MVSNRLMAGPDRVDQASIRKPTLTTGVIRGALPSRLWVERLPRMPPPTHFWPVIQRPPLGDPAAFAGIRLMRWALTMLAMGNFLAVSAFRDVDDDAVAEATAAFFARCGVQIQPVAESEPNRPRSDFNVFAPVGRWTVVLWPAYFNIHDVPVCTALSGDLATVVSTVHTYDSDYWTHVLLREGSVLDRYASVPDYFEAENVAELAEKWAGNAAVVAVAVDGDPALLAPYFHQAVGSEVRGKASPNDVFELGSEWVFTDFWRRAGIEYPRDVLSGRRFRLGDGWDKLIPVTSEPL